LSRRHLGVGRWIVLFASCGGLLSAADGTTGAYSLSEAGGFLNQYCLACHQGGGAAAKFHVEGLDTIESFRTRPDHWTRLVARVSNNEMPPKGSPAPDLGTREEFLDWVETTWRSQACAADLRPPPSLIRRLNRDEYAATVINLFDLQLDFSEEFPVDGPGGEGFDNAVETLFLSPLHSEKYVEIAKRVLNAASKEYKSRVKIFGPELDPDISEEQAAEKILRAFLPKAFRRPVDDETVASYVALFRVAREEGQDFEPAIFFTLRSVLVSPQFLFHVEAGEDEPELRQYELASRFSYFLWGSMPDEFLLDVAAAGKMDDPKVLRKLVPRMLRNDRSLEFADRFVKQWLRTRELEGAHGPDPELFPEYATNEELHSDILLQPVFFFQYVLRENKPLLNFLDSDHTILTGALAKHFGLVPAEKTSKNPEWMRLPTGSNRGGLLTMPAVLAVSSHSYRTSPVLRGAWILDSILGTPPPPPPPDVPELDDKQEGETPKSIRELLAQHSANAACASCHERIDPLGFALENYDAVGRWRNEYHGAAIDAASELLDGTRIEGPRGLKKALMDRNELFIRNLTKRMLGYAVGRGLTPADACAVETIVDRVEEADFEAWALVREIVLSAPFQEPSAEAQR
jgi:hypothetical protein